MDNNNEKNEDHNYENEQIHDNNSELSYICPNCQQQIITIHDDIVEDTVIICPKCGQTGIIRSLQKKQNINHTKPSKHIIMFAHSSDEGKKIKNPSFDLKILGLLLIIFGIIFQYLFNLLSFKIIFTLVIVGVIIFIFIPDNRKINIKFPRNNKEQQKSSISNINGFSKFFSYYYPNTQFDIAEKIAFILILWIVIIYFFTGVDDLDIFFILLYLGILFIRIFSAEYISSQLKRKLNVLTIAFLFIFIIIIVRRLYIFLNV